MIERIHLNPPSANHLQLSLVGPLLVFPTCPNPLALLELFSSPSPSPPAGPLFDLFPSVFTLISFSLPLPFNLPWPFVAAPSPHFVAHLPGVNHLRLRGCPRQHISIVCSMTPLLMGHLRISTQSSSPSVLPQPISARDWLTLPIQLFALFHGCGGPRGQLQGIPFLPPMPPIQEPAVAVLPSSPDRLEVGLIQSAPALSDLPLLFSFSFFDPPPHPNSTDAMTPLLSCM